MWKFTQSRWVVRKEVAAVTKVGDVLFDLRLGPTTAGTGAEWGFRAGRASPGPLPAALHGRREGLSGAHGRSEDQQGLGVHSAL